MIGIPEQVPERFLKMSVPELVAKTRREALEEAAKVCEAQSACYQLTDEQRRFGRGCAAAIRALIPLEGI